MSLLKFCDDDVVVVLHGMYTAHAEYSYQNLRFLSLPQTHCRTFFMHGKKAFMIHISSIHSISIPEL